MRACQVSEPELHGLVRMHRLCSLSMEQSLCRIESMYVRARILLQYVVGRMCASSRLRFVLCYRHMQLNSWSLLQLCFSVRLSI